MRVSTINRCNYLSRTNNNVSKTTKNVSFKGEWEYIEAYEDNPGGGQPIEDVPEHYIYHPYFRESETSINEAMKHRSKNDCVGSRLPYDAETKDAYYKVLPIKLAYQKTYWGTSTDHKFFEGNFDLFTVYNAYMEKENRKLTPKEDKLLDELGLKGEYKDEIFKWIDDEIGEKAFNDRFIGKDERDKDERKKIYAFLEENFNSIKEVVNDEKAFTMYAILGGSYCKTNMNTIKELKKEYQNGEIIDKKTLPCSLSGDIYKTCRKILPQKSPDNDKKAKIMKLVCDEYFKRTPNLEDYQLLSDKNLSELYFQLKQKPIIYQAIGIESDDKATYYKSLDLASNDYNKDIDRSEYLYSYVDAKRNIPNDIDKEKAVKVLDLIQKIPNAPTSYGTSDFSYAIVLRDLLFDTPEKPMVLRAMFHYSNSPKVAKLKEKFKNQENDEILKFDIFS